MRRWISLGWLILAAALAGCSSSEKPAATPVPSIPASIPSPEVSSQPAPTDSPVPTAFLTLETYTGPYTNRVSLLDGICFEFLAGLSGQTWLWTTPEDLLTFYDQVDSSQRCPHAVTRGTFDFNGYVLAGAVSSGTGCDAAYRVITLVQDDTAHTQTLTLEFDVLPGCPYDLVEPLLIAVPYPPEGYHFNISIASP